MRQIIIIIVILLSKLNSMPIDEQIDEINERSTDGKQELVGNNIELPVIIDSDENDLRFRDENSLRN